MRIAHLADLHLGFVRYNRDGPSGINQRQLDVQLAFSHAIGAIIAAKPDLVLVAGDVFHSVRPSNLVIVQAKREFRRLRAALPHAMIAMVAGNHDSPRSSSTGHPLLHFEDLGSPLAIATTKSTSVIVNAETTLTLVPSTGLSNVPVPEDDHVNILLMHAAIQGMRYGRVGATGHFEDLGSNEFIKGKSWDYVALGDYHVAHQVAERAWYSGSIEYTSSNPWDELNDEERHGRRGQKGWLLVDLDQRGCSVTFQPIELARQHYDLPVINAATLLPDLVSVAIAENAAGFNVTREIVRQVIVNLPRAARRQLDHKLIQRLKGESGGFYQLDIRLPPRSLIRPPFVTLMSEATMCDVCDDTKVAPDGGPCWACDEDAAGQRTRESLERETPFVKLFDGHVEQMPTDLADAYIKGTLTVDQIVARMDEEQDPYA